MTYDQAQSPRIRQRNGMENPGIRLLDSSALPEVAYKGQLIYQTDLDILAVWDGHAWQGIGDQSFNVTYVGPTPPPTAVAGDHWLDTTSNILYVWVDGVGWQEPVNIPDDSVGEPELAPDAITSKHTITGAVFQTSAGGNRMVMRNDGFGGVLQGFSGNPSEVSPSVVNPGFDTGRPTLQLRAGSSTGTPGATLLLWGDSSVGSRKWQLNASGQVLGDHTANDHYSSNQTGGSAQDAEFGASGLVKRKVSSQRYKENIQNLSYPADQLLQLVPRQFALIEDEDKQPHAGFIAEEAAGLDLAPWVVLDEQDRPDGFRYPEWTAALQTICRAQQQQIQDLTARVEALEGRG